MVVLIRIADGGTCVRVSEIIRTLAIEAALPCASEFSMPSGELAMVIDRPLKSVSPVS